MILTRKQFKEHFQGLDSRLTVYGGPLWIPESFDGRKIRCRWFVCVRPLGIGDQSFLGRYWEWCDSTLTGEVRCFSSSYDDDGEEWWGFTHKRDIAWWQLKWVQ